MTVDVELARRIAQLEFAGLSPRAVEVTKRMIFDCVGVALAGSREPPASTVRSLVVAEGCAPRSTVWGTGVRTSEGNAALANGTAAHALDYDDGHVASSTHSSTVLLPALLAVAESRHLSGQQVLVAYIAGIEAMTALGSAMNPLHYELGWHSTSTLGTIGAAAAVARLLDLDAVAIAAALGIAASHAHGVRRNFGSATKPLHAGTAARDGVFAALLAERGFTAGDDVLAGPRGFLALFADGTPTSALDLPDDLTGEQAMGGYVIKRFPSCAATHTAIDASLVLRDEHAVGLELIASIVCYVDPRVLDILRADLPRTGLEGKFSLEYCVAVALSQGTVTLADFTDERVNDATVLRLARRVEMRADEGVHLWPRMGVRFVADLTDGRRIVIDRSVARGNSTGEPLEWSEIVDKFRDCAHSGGMTARATDQVINTLERLDAVSDVADIVALLDPS